MTWRRLLDQVVIAIHDEQIAVHGGSSGIRDAGLISSALSRPKHKANYTDSSVFDLAAAYAFGIIRNLPFVDGNKRTGFLAAYVSLNINGWELRSTEVEAVNAVIDLAAGEMDEPGFSDWLKNKSFMRAARK